MGHFGISLFPSPISGAKINASLKKNSGVHVFKDTGELLERKGAALPGGPPVAGVANQAPG